MKLWYFIIVVLASIVATCCHTTAEKKAVVGRVYPYIDTVNSPIDSNHSTVYYVRHTGPKTQEVIDSQRLSWRVIERDTPPFPAP